ncbi:MAG: hypothetical protein IEMM0008_0021 [bacterium]|nr:MAG: hypothetical protein IEMM0008_0021 [bacterium]
MKRLKLIISLAIITVSIGTCGFTEKQPQQRNSKKIASGKININTIEGQIVYLMKAHQRFLNQHFGSMEKELDAFDRDFFVNIHFMKDGATNSFFKTIKANVEKGNIPSSMMQISYTRFTSINGKYTGTHYEYKSDGKNVVLIKATNNNGNILKAIYNYNTKGKLLNVKEFKGNEMISKKVHSIEI